MPFCFFFSSLSLCFQHAFSDFFKAPSFLYFFNLFGTAWVVLVYECFVLKSHQSFWMLLYTFLQFLVLDNIIHSTLSFVHLFNGTSHVSHPTSWIVLSSFSFQLNKIKLYQKILHTYQKTTHLSVQFKSILVILIPFFPAVWLGSQCKNSLLSIGITQRRSVFMLWEHLR